MLLVMAALRRCEQLQDRSRISPPAFRCLVCAWHWRARRSRSLPTSGACRSLGSAGTNADRMRDTVCGISCTVSGLFTTGCSCAFHVKPSPRPARLLLSPFLSPLSNSPLSSKYESRISLSRSMSTLLRHSLDEVSDAGPHETGVTRRRHSLDEVSDAGPHSSHAPQMSGSGEAMNATINGCAARTMPRAFGRFSCGKFFLGSLSQTVRFDAFDGAVDRRSMRGVHGQTMYKPFWNENFGGRGVIQDKRGFN